MAIYYTIIDVPMGGQVLEATFDDSNKLLYIPMDEANSDYQRYLNPEADQPIGGNK
jgi:hypothetical protein